MPEVMTAREIDAVIAELAMGIMPRKGHYFQDGDQVFPDRQKGPLGHMRAPHYSTDPAASYQLRQRMRELGWYTRAESTPGGKHTACAWRNGQVFTVRADTEMMADALAYCAALGRPVELRA